MGPFSFTVTAHSIAMPISNLFLNLVPCDSEFYFYPALNQRENICCQSGCHHVKCCVGRGAECPAAPDQTADNRTNEFTDHALYSPLSASGIEGRGAEKGQTGFALAKNGVQGILRLREG